MSLLRVVRTSFSIPDQNEVVATGALDEERFSHWYCVACGHPHHNMTKHHRVPKRVAWKIPRSVWVPIIGEQRIVPMCMPCHRFIETGKKGPCPHKIYAKQARLTWVRLREEIALFEKIAYERTEELIRKCKLEAEGDA